MLLGEELILLLLDDDSGRWLVPRRAVRRAARVALVVELLARRAISLDDDGLLVPGLPGATGGDPVLDSAATQVAGHRPQELTEPDRRELRVLVERLRGRGVLRRGYLWWRRHLPRDGHPEAGVRARLLEALTVRLRPDRHTALLVAIVFEMDLLARLFPDHDPTALAMRAATITSQLRDDAHYFPSTLEQDAAGRDGLGLSGLADGAGTILDGVGAALEALDLMVTAGRLLLAPVRVVFRLLGDLP